MSVAALKNRLIDELDARFQTFGFTRWSDSSAFYGVRYDRWKGDVRQSVDPAISAHQNQLEFGVPYVSVTITPAEDFIAKFEDRNSSLGDTSFRSTIGFRPEWKCGLSIFQTSKILADVKDVTEVADNFVSWIVKRGSTFWERFSDPYEILKILVGEDKNSFKFAGGPSAIKIKKAIALAFVLEGASKAHEIANLKLSELAVREQTKTLNEVKRWLEKALPSEPGKKESA